MSWINGLLIGAGEGLRSGSRTYFSELARRKEQEQQDLAREDQRVTAIDRMMRERDEFAERKRANRAQEELERDRNVQSSMDRMLARENSRYGADEATRRAVETALIRAQSAQTVAGMPPRTRPRQPTPASPDGMSASQREGRMLLKRMYTNPAEKAAFEDAWRKAREAFPDADPGDVAVAAQRYLDRLKRDQDSRF
jgi:hypothetical protein